MSRSRWNRSRCIGASSRSTSALRAASILARSSRSSELASSIAVRW
jgi:hypothetical protein